MTHIATARLVRLDTVLQELGLTARDFASGEIGVSFTVNYKGQDKRIRITHSLMKIARNTASLRRVILHQLGEKVG